MNSKITLSILFITLLSTLVFADAPVPASYWNLTVAVAEIVGKFDDDCAYPNLAERGTIVGGLLGSDEYRNVLLAEFYQKLLQREPHQSGLMHLKDLLANGATEKDVITVLVDSNEYWIKNGSTNRSFVRSLYDRLLDRQGNYDQNEIDHWVGRIQQSGRRLVIRGFLLSDEYNRKFIAKKYSELFNRTASENEVNHWMSALARTENNKLREKIVRAILTSDEYYNKLGNTTKKLIQQLNKDLLKRTVRFPL